MMILEVEHINTHFTYISCKKECDCIHIVVDVRLFKLNMKLRIYSISSDISTELSLSSFIVWNDCKVVPDTGAWMLWSKGVTCVYNLSAVSAGNSVWPRVIFHVVFIDE
jgi:hypothetical protein